MAFLITIQRDRCDQFFSDRLLIRSEKDALIKISFYEIFAYDDYSSDLPKGFTK